MRVKTSVVALAVVVALAMQTMLVAAEKNSTAKAPKSTSSKSASKAPTAKSSTAKSASKAKAAKPAAKKLTGRLPAHYSKLVDQEQRQEIYQLQADFAEKAEALEAKLQKDLAKLAEERNEEIRDVLSKTQQAELDKLAASGGKKSSKRSASSKSAAKSTGKSTGKSTSAKMAKKAA